MGFVDPLLVKLAFRRAHSHGRETIEFRNAALIAQF